MTPRVKTTFKLPVNFYRYTGCCITQDNILHRQPSEYNKEINLFVAQYNFFFKFKQSKSKNINFKRLQSLQLNFTTDINFKGYLYIFHIISIGIGHER